MACETEAADLQEARLGYNDIMDDMWDKGFDYGASSLKVGFLAGGLAALVLATIPNPLTISIAAGLLSLAKAEQLKVEIEFWGLYNDHKLSELTYNELEAIYKACISTNSP